MNRLCSTNVQVNVSYSPSVGLANTVSDVTVCPKFSVFVHLAVVPVDIVNDSSGANAFGTSLTPAVGVGSGVREYDL